MLINLTPYSVVNTLEIDEKDYANLVRLKTGGWTNCHDKLEWLAKLHYLRSGLKEEKISLSEFEAKEKRLALKWLEKQF